MYQPPNAIRMHVALADIEPEIWRRLVVPVDWRLDRLHLVLQAAFSWTNGHLHEFRIGGLRYGDLNLLDDGFGGPRVFDYTEISLRDFVGKDSSFIYVYDFGDNWQHLIRIEEWLTLETEPRHAICLEGARARPPEDVGGPWAYDDFLEIITDPEHDDHRSTLRWAGGHFDPEWFDLDLINKDLRNTFRANARRRLHQPKPKSKWS
ncbi:plasmid pRiA4b ORF-3 family protein [Paracoccus onubensis]|uniref:plasmid pRiA4b ORF-3 family protein n=1 Tax=Paracoccus onubensis TaxID=1675788 RepID=UPI00273067E6|nr:plasmid pRiA4b ORF-3 family protein [Paracoccus onubensis]MDP0926561.1 plasmid pRiA4b ORF-3 family protein [Paracoccus onubensis]